MIKIRMFKINYNKIFTVKINKKRINNLIIKILKIVLIMNQIKGNKY